jgi:hypothetical protein
VEKTAKEIQIEKVSELLKLAAIEALRSVVPDATMPERRLHFVDVPEFVRQFKKSWLMFYPKEISDCFNGSLFFLFYKNFSITNIQMTEFISLLRLHTFDSDSNESFSEVDITSNDEYNFALENLWSSYSDETSADTVELAKEQIAKVSKRVAVDAAALLTRTIIADFTFTGCIIHIPRSLYVDARSVTYESGYIHSSGACPAASLALPHRHLLRETPLCTRSHCLRSSRSGPGKAPLASGPTAPLGFALR